MFLLFFITENTHTMRRNTIVTHKYITNTHIRDLRVHCSNMNVGDAMDGHIKYINIE